jgi:hypothetical protein
MRRVLQARSYGYIAYVLRFATRDARTLLAETIQDPDLTTGATGLLGSSDLARIRLHARGAGLTISAAPNHGMFSRARPPGMLLRARRSGKARLGRELGGDRL